MKEMSFQEFIKSRINAQRYFQIHNIFSMILIGWLAYELCCLLPANDPALGMMGFMAIVAGSLIFLTFIVKLRHQILSRQGKSAILEFIQSAIYQARMNQNYEILSQLLDSRYSFHTVYAMSQYPEEAFNYDQLTRWVKLKESMVYFKKHNLQIEDSADINKMANYIRAVSPEFVEALQKQPDKN